MRRVQLLAGHHEEIQSTHGSRVTPDSLLLPPDEGVEVLLDQFANDICLSCSLANIIHEYRPILRSAKSALGPWTAPILKIM